MSSSAGALAAFEIPIARARAAAAWSQLIFVYSYTHRASCFTPIESSTLEHCVEAFCLCLVFNQTRPRNNHGVDTWSHSRIGSGCDNDIGSRAQVFDSTVGAGANEDVVE
jgi:hypothetical protein